MKELEDDLDGTDDPCGSGGTRADCEMVVEVHSQKWRSLQNMNMLQLARPRTVRKGACSVV